MKQKRVAAIHDISGFGKCSLTVALPILSAAGIETCALPTSVLSTHTGGFPGYTFRDLTEDIPAITEHWSSIGLSFDAIYTGYLGSSKQVSMVSEFIDRFRSDKTLVIVDPAMADNGTLYSGFSNDFPKLMAKLCSKADVIVPNITEAALMLGEEYRKPVYSPEYINMLINELQGLCKKSIVLTGVSMTDDELGAACFDGIETNYIMGKRIDQMFHGTGDVFASALVSALINSKDIKTSTRIAVDFTCNAINKTIENNPGRNYGVNFEQALPKLIKQLNLE